MSEYLSIYQKDYLWHEPPPHFPRADSICVSKGPVKPDKYTCGCDREAVCRTTETNEKLILQKCPETRVPQYSSSTDACLKKLMEDNPNLFSVMRKVPIAPALKKFNDDRLRSTYQVDYLHAGKEEETHWPEEKTPCPMDDPGPKKIDCRPSQNSRLAVLKMMREGSLPKPEPCAAKPKYKYARSRKEKDVPQFQLKVMPAWSTEYRDMINGTANEVLKIMRLTKAQREKIELHRKYRQPICIA